MGDIEEKRLRLASARRKVRSFLIQVAALEASDFAQQDAVDAIREVKAVFQQHSKQLARQKPTSKTLDGLCSAVIGDSQTFTSVLGILLRSSNVRNPFEVFYPLRNLTRKIIPEAKLIISSEWDWSPFMTFGNLKGVVFIGSPATEADNVLIIPLAGHEIGHFMWWRYKLERWANKKITNYLSANPLTGPAASEFGECTHRAITRIEEVFCDLVGLYLFAESYLYAYDHILAPGGGPRADGYPSSENRIRYLQMAAAAWKIRYAPGLFSGWYPSHSDAADPLTEAADEIVEALVPALIETAHRRLNRLAGPKPNPKTIQLIAGSLRDRVPYGKQVKLSEALCAGWSVLREEGGLGRPEEAAQCDCLHEVLLKTVEVSEFLRRAKDA